MKPSLAVGLLAIKKLTPSPQPNKPQKQLVEHRVLNRIVEVSGEISHARTVAAYRGSFKPETP
jgi:hypothetical protein